MKILVVDDEHLINQYIVQCIQTADAGSRIAGAVSSGAKALKALEETAVDLAFVDITMPKMNGLDLLREIKARHPSVTVVMLTCHDEFEYARAAMQNGADNYVLKSELTPSYMKKILENVRETRKKRGVDQLTSQVLQRSYLKKIVAGGSDIYIATEEDLRKNNILLRDDAFVALCFRNTSRNLNAVVGAAEVDFENPLLYAYSEELSILLLNVRRSGKKWNTVEDLCREVDSYFEKLESQMDGRIGFSRVFFRMARLYAAISEALESLNNKFYGCEVPGHAGYGDRVEQLHQLVMRGDIRLEEDNPRAACKALEEILQFAETAHPDAAALKEGIRHLYRAAEERCHLLAGHSEDQILRVEDYAQLRQMARELAAGLMEVRKKYSGPIQQAVDYIDQHYTEDLTQNTVADHVFLNREHLSRQFKKEVGTSFSEYLTTLRMRQARKLLLTTSLRVSEIATRVGVPNMSYFSTVFRKEFQCSPSDIRDGKRERAVENGGKP